MIRTPGQAAALAQSYEAEIIYQADVYNDSCRGKLTPLYRWYQAGALDKYSGSFVPNDDIRELFSRLPRDYIAGIKFSCQDIGTLVLWQQHKIVYHIDPDIWAELGDADESTHIPPNLFRQLAHPDPFVAFPEPMLVQIDSNQIQHVEGFFVDGRTLAPTDSVTGYVQRSTHHPAASSIGLLLCGPLFDMNGKPIRIEDGRQDYIYTRVRVPGEGGTVKDIIDTTGNKFLNLATTDSWKQNVPQLIKRSAALLIYLCATNADLTPTPNPPPKRVKGGGKPKRNPKVVGVGYKVGAALRAYKTRQREMAKATGKTVAPHIRRSHFHTYKVGPGRQRTEVKWLSPILVNPTGEAAETPTVIGVNK